MKANISITTTMLTIGLGLSLSFTSCKEEAYTTPDLIPQVDNINTFEVTNDQIPIEYKVRMMDSLVTSNANLPIAGAGSLWNDPFYGHVDNELYFQVTVPSVGYQFPKGAIIDSAFVSLPYSRVAYGDSNAVSKYDLFMINDMSFKADPTSIKYYNFSSIAVNPTPIASYSGVVNKLDKDTVAYPGNDTLINQLRFRLDNATLAYIKTIDSLKTRNNSEFTKFLNGFCIKPSASLTASERQSLHYFILEPSNAANNFRKARLEVFYRTNDTVRGVVSFPFDKRYSAFYTRVNRSYGGFPIQNYAVNGKVMDSLLITGRPGFDTDIKLSNLNSIPKSVINLGRITIKLLKENSIFTPPDLISVTGLDNDGKEITLADYGVSGIDNMEYQDLAKKFVGGVRTVQKIDGVEYWVYEINIPRTIQKAVHEGNNFISLRLNAYTLYPGAYRMVIPSTSTLNKSGVKLSIIYTKI